MRSPKRKPPEAHVPAPTGRHTFVGTIVAVKIGDFGPRWTVKVDTAGGSWLANGAVPRAVLDVVDYPTPNVPNVIRGLDVEITATLVPGRDAHFAFAKRPIAKIIPSCHADCVTHALRTACRARRGVQAPLPQIDAVCALAECWPAWTVGDTLRVLAERKFICNGTVLDGRRLEDLCRGYFHDIETDKISRCDGCASSNGYAAQVSDDDVAALPEARAFLRGARKLERAARRALNACTRADHDALRASPARWRAATQNKRPQRDAHVGEVLELAECQRCNSTLAIVISPAKGEE